MRRILLAMGIRCARLIEDEVLVGWIIWRCPFASRDNHFGLCEKSFYIAEAKHGHSTSPALPRRHSYHLANAKGGVGI